MFCLSRLCKSIRSIKENDLRKSLGLSCLSSSSHSAEEEQEQEEETGDESKQDGDVFESDQDSFDSPQTNCPGGNSDKCNDECQKHLKYTCYICGQKNTWPWKKQGSLDKGEEGGEGKEGKEEEIEMDGKGVGGKEKGERGGVGQLVFESKSGSGTIIKSSFNKHKRKRDVGEGKDQDLDKSDTKRNRVQTTKSLITCTTPHCPGVSIDGKDSRLATQLLDSLKRKLERKSVLAGDSVHSQSSSLCLIWKWACEFDPSKKQHLQNSDGKDKDGDKFINHLAIACPTGYEYIINLMNRVVGNNINDSDWLSFTSV